MSAQAEPMLVSLPDVCDATAAALLAVKLLSMRGSPVGIDASSVEKVSTLSMQVLISARITWTTDGLAFSIERSSQSFRQAVETLGLQTLLRRTN